MSFKKLLISGVAMLSLAGFMALALPQPAAALFGDSKKQACEGIQGTTAANGDCTTGGTTINDLISTVIDVLSLIVGVVAVIMIIVGGFRYVTAAGDSSNITAAKNTIVYAIIGLVFVAFAQFIVQFVLDKAISAPPPPTNSPTNPTP